MANFMLFIFYTKESFFSRLNYCYTCIINEFRDILFENDSLVRKRSLLGMCGNIKYSTFFNIIPEIDATSIEFITWIMNQRQKNIHNPFL